MSPASDMPADAHDSSASKITIKGFSLNSKATAKSINFVAKTKSLSMTLGKRSRTTLHEGSGDEDEEISRHEAVTGFDIRDGGALTMEKREANGPLIIPKPWSKNWREEIKRHRQRGKNLLPPEVQAQRGEGRAGETETALSEDAEPKWGLSITEKTSVERKTVARDAQISNDGTAVHRESDTESAPEKHREKTDDECAIEALMGIKSDTKFSNLLIPIATATSEDDYPGRISEEDAYRRAVRVAPDVSTLEDYERIPVEEFGAALLRGMGWKEDDVKKGRVERPKEVKRRQNLLGLGATELKEAEELGAWVQKSDPKRLGGGRVGERRPRANEYREREERKRESQDERYGGSYRRDRGDYKDEDRRR